MNEIIGVAVYLVLALVVAVGFWAAYSKAGSGKKRNSAPDLPIARCSSCQNCEASAAAEAER